MAYGTKYYLGWHSDTKNGYIYIDKLNYEGVATQLTLAASGFRISTNTSDNVVGMNAEFEIQNDREDYFELDPLLLNQEREYRIRIEKVIPDQVSVPLLMDTVDFTFDTVEIRYDQTETGIPNVSLFEGYLNCNSTTQKYLQRHTIKLVASSYLSKLEDAAIPSVETLQNITFINLIDAILRETRSVFPIRVNTSLKAEGDVRGTGQTCFNKNGVFTELFWQDEAEKDTGLIVIRKILAPFHCKLYYKNKVWYIERQQEIWGTSISYVQYDSGVSYGPTDAGMVITIAKTVKDVHSFVFTGQTQTREVTPGAKTIKVLLNDKRYISLSKKDLTDTTVVTDADHVPAFRKWEAYDPGSNVTWSNFGLSRGSIKNSVTRGLYPANPVMSKDQGLKTLFKTTVVGENDVLEIKLKYMIDKASFYHDIGKLEDLIFTFHWWLKDIVENKYVEGPVEDPDSTIQSDVWGLFPEGTTLAAVQVIDNVPGTSFNKADYVLDLTISIPIGKVETYVNGIFNGYLTGDRTFLLCIGTEVFRNENMEENLLENQGVPWAAYGDIFITETGDDQENVITGTINGNFMNKKEIPLDLYDSESYSYSNAILRGDSLDSRTSRWGSLGGSYEVVERGICYGLSNPPTVANTKIINGTGFGSFTSFIGGLAENTTYYVRAYAIDGSGTVYYGSVESFTTSIIAIGSRYQGGIVGYILQPGDPGYEVGNPHGLIVSLNNLSEGVAIGRINGGGPYTSDANRYELGDGPANTAGILANPVQNDYGISLIQAYNDQMAGGYNDWFLPSWMELKKILFNKDAIGGFINWYYWTSSEPVNGDLGTFVSEWKYAHAINATEPAGSIQFIQRIQNDGYWKKTHAFAIRAVRAF